MSDIRTVREAKYLGKTVEAVNFTPSKYIDDNETVPPGTRGKVVHVDDTGTLAVDWENGARVGVLVQDTVRLVEDGDDGD